MVDEEDIDCVRRNHVRINRALEITISRITITAVNIEFCECSSDLSRPLGQVKESTLMMARAEEHGLFCSGISSMQRYVPYSAAHLTCPIRQVHLHMHPQPMSAFIAFTWCAIFYAASSHALAVLTPTTRRLWHKWNLGANLLPVVEILAPKELDQKYLLMPNPRREEAPQHRSVAHETHHVAHDQLRTQPPPKEAKVAWMPQAAIDSGRHQNVLLLLRLLHNMVEARPCLDHRHRPHDLPDHHQRKPKQHGQHTEVKRRPLPPGKQ